MVVTKLFIYLAALSNNNKTGMFKSLRIEPQWLANFIYLVKCLAGVVICYILYREIPQFPFYWSIVSVALALSPDNNSKLAYNRIKANLLGCAVGVCLYPLQLPNLLLLCVGVTIVICVGLAIGAADTLRSALAGLIIVTLQVEQGKHWYIALERVLCGVAGCVVALLLTVVFNPISAKGGRK